MTNPLIAQSNGFGRKILIAGRIFAIQKVGLGIGKGRFIKAKQKSFMGHSRSPGNWRVYQ